LSWQTMTQEAGPDSAGSYRRELWKNQIWQGLNFAGKGAFLALLTPMMLSHWGALKFGVFAMASSLVVSLNMLDFGVRSLTRLRLVEAGAESSPTETLKVMAPGLSAFGLVAVLAFFLAVLMTAVGWMGQLFKLAPDDAWVMALTTGLTGFFLFSLLLLEPLCAKGNLSAVKAANTVGVLLALPLVAGCIWKGGGVALTLGIYFFALTVPNLVLALNLKLSHVRWKEVASAVNAREIWRTYCEGGWFYVTTIAFMAKTHMLTLIVGALLGPVEAGVFYIALRVSELVSGVGGTASETAVAALADAPSEADKRHTFQHAWGFAALLTLHGVLLLGFAGERILQLWLGKDLLAPALLGWGMAIFGLEGVFSRMVVNSSMGLGLVRDGAKGNVIESILLIAVISLFLAKAGLGAAFLSGGIGFLPLLPVAGLLCRRMGGNWVACWLHPLKAALPSLGVNLILLAPTPWVPLWLFCLLIALSGLVALWGLKCVKASESTP